MLCSGDKYLGRKSFAVAKDNGRTRPCVVAALQQSALLAVGLALGAGLASPAYAQTDPQVQDAIQANGAKPVPKPPLQVEASLEAAYDDNIYRVDDRTTDPTDDIIVTPTVQVTYDRDNGIRRLTLRGLAGYDWFTSNGGRSKPRFEIEGSGRFLVAGTCAISPLANYRQQRADYGDLNSATENLQKFSTLAVSADCKRPGLYPVVAWQRDTTRNGDGFEYADQTSNRYRGGIGYDRPSLGSITAYYEHITANRPGLGLENRSDAVGVSFERSVSPLTEINADVRYMHVDSTSAAVGEYKGLAWDLSVATTAIPRVKITATNERTIVNDSLIATGFAIRTAFRLQADVSLSELTSIGAYGEFARRDFRQDAAIRPFSYTRDQVKQYGIVLRRKLNDRFSLEGGVSRFDRETNSDVSNYGATRVTLGITMRS